MRIILETLLGLKWGIKCFCYEKDGPNTKTVSVEHSGHYLFTEGITLEGQV